MVAWHVLNSAMPKGLGFVTPFCVPGASMWKHLADDYPAFYNAKDADMALRNWLQIKEDLEKNGLWQVYDRHVIKLNQALTYMSEKGLLRDEPYRDECELRVKVMLEELDGQIDLAVPTKARRLKVYKKQPKNTTNLVEVERLTKVKKCSVCGTTNPLKAHFKPIGSKKTKLGEVNPCQEGFVQESEELAILFARPLPWRISKVGLTDYQRAMGHKAIINRQEDRVTFDGNAMKRLQERYPKDSLYPLISRQRYLTKLLGTYIGKKQPDGSVKGGMPMGKDGRGHPSFNFNPSTLRLACPFFHQLPRPGKPDDPHTWIRNMVVPAKGNIFGARDFSGIEAVLVGYEAKDPNYIWLAKHDVHSFYTIHALYGLGDPRVSANDLPSMSWDRDKLAARLKDIKKEFSWDRNQLYKHLTHAINFGQGPKGAVEKIYKDTGVLHSVGLVGKVMGVYKELFPSITKWHHEMRLQAEDGHLRNAFGYVGRFYRVWAWEKDITGEWIRKPGDDAEAVLAFKPQSTAAAMIKEAILRLYFDCFEEAGQFLRLQVHDELLWECPEELQDHVDKVVQEEMERQVPEMPLPPEWGMGPSLTVMTEPKRGFTWGTMH